MRYINNKPVKLCQYCSTPLDKDYEICPYCNNVLKEKPKDEQNQSYKTSHENDDDFVYTYDKRSKSKKAGIILGVCGGFLAMAVIVFIIVVSSNVSEVKNIKTEPASQTARAVQATPPAQSAATAASNPVVVSMEKPNKVKIAKVTSKKGAFKVKWKKVAGATKYRIKVSSNKKGNRDVCYETVNSGRNTVTIKGLKRKKNYYIKVKAIAVNYGVKVEGDYSKSVIKKTK